MPTLSKVTDSYQNEPIECAKIVFDEPGSYKFAHIVNAATSYEFQMVAKAAAATTLTIECGDTTKTVAITTSWDRYILAFPNVTNSNDSLYITCPTGTYYFYNLQLERAKNPSGWRPAPEDAIDYADQVSQAAVDAQTQLDVFNKLTNNGQTQGIYLQNGKIYINASFIQSGTISANYISGGSIDAGDVSIVNLIVDHVRSYSSGNTSVLESQSSYLDLRKLVSNVWKQRVGIYIGSNGEGIIRVSDGDVDASGSPLGGTSMRTFIESDRIMCGLDENNYYQGDVKTKDVTATGTVSCASVSATGAVSAGSVSSSGAISATGNISSSGNISASSGNGTFKYINADTIGSEKKSTTLDTVNDSWSFSITGCRFICIEGQAGSLEIQTTVIPCAAINGYTYGWRLATGTTAYTVSRSGSTCTVTLTTASNSTCRLLRCYSIV